MDALKKIILSLLSLPDSRQESLDWPKIIKMYNLVNDTRYSLDDLDKILADLETEYSPGT